MFLGLRVGVETRAYVGTVCFQVWVCVCCQFVGMFLSVYVYVCCHFVGMF